jgi:hypothetical protein
MSVKIINKKDYILVELQTIEYWEIMEALGRLFKMPEYLEKNTIWVSSAERLNLSYDHLYKIRDVISEHFPKNSKRGSKTAIVAKTGLLEGIADSYAKIVKNLPFEAGVFSDLQSVEDWIIEK